MSELHRKWGAMRRSCGVLGGEGWSVHYTLDGWKLLKFCKDSNCIKFAEIYAQK
jgi:hypothetical protein